MSLNPNATAFNPKAAAFTPKSAVAEPPRSAPVAVQASAPESWEESAPQVPEPEPKIESKTVVEDREESEEDEVLEDEELARELLRVKLEEEREKREEEMLRKLGSEEDKRDHVNLVFIGHVDAGKSTICGQLLYLTGMVDDRTLSKYEREAKEKGRDSWWLAFVMDSNEEERAKGKTVEVGRAHFTTETKRFTVLDAPGHKNYVPNMIGGASQADVGILVISARKGEFETGFDRGGQTREHARLAKTVGVKQLVIIVNKMDDPTVGWSSERFNECTTKLVPFLKSVGFNPKKDITFIPVSGLTGKNMKVPVSKEECSWWNGPTLIQALDSLPPIVRPSTGPLRIPIIDKYKERGITFIMGKIESGSLKKGDKYIIMPSKDVVEIVSINTDLTEVDTARAGENLRIGLKGTEEENIHAGFVLSDLDNPCTVATKFEVQLALLGLTKPIFTAGYEAVIHLHSTVEEIVVNELVATLDMKTGERSQTKPAFVKSGDALIARLQSAQPVCVEKFSDFPQLGRFTLRDAGKTIAVGKVMAIARTGQKSATR